MKLKDRLAMMNPDEIVYIGSQSSYVFIGTANDALSKMEDISDDYYKRYLTAMESTKRTYSYKLTRIPICEQQIAELEENIRNYNDQIQFFSKLYDELRDKPDTLERYQEMHEIQLEIVHFQNCISSTQNRVEDVKGTLTGYKRDVKNNEARIPEINEIVTNWKDMLERDVVNEYPHKYVSLWGTTLLIEGGETGEYWTYDEFVNDKGLKPGQVRR